MKLDTYVITNADLVPGRGHVYIAREATAGGADVIQFREKHTDTGEMIRVATTLQKICRQCGATFIVNDRVDVALAMDADGVHVGQQDMPAAIARRLIGPNKLLGVSAGSVEAALRAEADGADYVGVGMIFQAGLKADIRTAKGVDVLREVSRAVKIPVVAIGGIDHGNAAACIEAGAVGCAVITAVVNAPDVRQATAGLAQIIRETKERLGR
ncbi:MAG: thiamine phosphate synthase [Chloroflexi bacterium]|nr:thiamine phosphate synthase [Chloroflexota bacterium]